MEIKKLLLLGVAFFVFTSVSNAQMVDEKWMNIAKEYRTKFPDDKVVLTNSKEEYSFEIVTKKDVATLIAYKDVTEEYITLKDNEIVQFGDGYDSFSTIDKLTGEVSYGGNFKRLPLQINEGEYTSEEIFDSDSKYKYVILPFATLGTRCSGYYYKTYSDARYLTASYLTDNYPILEKTIEVEVPKNVDINIKTFNFDGYDITTSVTNDDKKGIKKYIYTLKNAASVSNESYSPAASKQFPHIVFECKSFTDKNGTKHQLFENTLDQYKWYKSLVNQIENNDTDLQPLVDKLVAGKTTDLEKIKSIYYWVQDNIKYIAFERGVAGFKPDAAAMVCKNKFGDCKGMANLLTTLLKKAGYDARLAWIGTNDIPYDYSLQNLIVDNHMICALKLNNKFYFLDGTEKYIAFDDYANRIQGRQVLIDDGDDKYILEKVPTLPIDRNQLIEKRNVTLEGDLLKQKVTEIYKGESQTNFLRGVNDVSNNKKEKALVSYLSGRNVNIEIANISQTEFTEREKPIEISYDAQVKNRVTNVGNEMYVSIDMSNDFEGFITKDKRKNSIEVDEDINRNYETIFTIPAGYKVKHLPTALNVTNNQYSFAASYSQQGSNIIFNKKLVLKKQLITKPNFSTWNADLKKLKEMNNEQIVLEKQ